MLLVRKVIEEQCSDYYYSDCYYNTVIIAKCVLWCKTWPLCNTLSACPLRPLDTKKVSGDPQWLWRSVQTMQICSLGQGTVSPWSIVPRCSRMLQVLPTMSDSWDYETWELSDIVGMQHPGIALTMFYGDTVPCSKEKSCIVWTNHNSHWFSNYIVSLIGLM